MSDQERYKPDTPQLLDRETLEAALEGLLLQREKLELRIQHVRELLGITDTDSTPKPKRKYTEEARQRIVEAQKKRWMEFRKKKGRGKGD